MKNEILRYTVIDTSIGPVGVAASGVGIVCIEMNCFNVDEFASELAGRFGADAILKPRDSLLQRVGAQLTTYLDGKRRSFNLQLDLRVTDFRRRVLEKVSGIPYGQTATYGEIARWVVSPRAARAVGRAVGANPIPLIIPCHRVVAAGGKLGGFGGGLELKKKLLDLEKAVICRS